MELAFAHESLPSRRLLQKGGVLDEEQISDVVRVFLWGRAIADLLFSVVVPECTLLPLAGKLQLDGEVVVEQRERGRLEKSETQHTKQNTEDRKMLFPKHPETVEFFNHSSRSLQTNYCHFYAHSLGANGRGGAVQSQDGNLVWNRHHHFFFAALHVNRAACDELNDHEVAASDERCAAKGSKQLRCHRCAYWNFDKQTGEPPCGKGNRLSQFAYARGDGGGMHDSARAALTAAIAAVKTAGESPDL